MSNTTTTPVAPNTVILNLLKELRENIAQQQGAASASSSSLKQTVAQLDRAAQPLVIMHTLTSFLFRQDNHNVFTAQEALSVLGFLVQTNPSLYLKPASQAIREEATRLTSSADPMIVSTDLMKAIIDQIASTNVQAAANATDAIVACCRKLGLAFAETALVAISNHWQEALRRMPSDKANASTVAIRCASAVIDLVAIDEQMMKLGVERGVVKLMLEMLQDDQDPLLQMSVLDLIEKMAQTRPMHHGLAMWLFSNEVLIPLLQLAGGSESDDEPDPILGGPALRVVAALCKLSQVDARVFEAERPLLTGFHRALHNFEGSGELDRLAMIDAISSFAGASAEALDLVLDDPVTRQGWLSLHVSQSKLKAAILVSVARVLNPPAEQLQQDGASRHSNADLLKLYSFVGRANNQESTAMLLNFGKSPLPEIRLGTYALLEAVAKLPTGGQVLLSTANFIDFLLSREEEKTKEGREGRFAIVQAINESPVKGLLADEIVKKIEKHVAQGPHYVKTIPWELATES